MSFRPFGTPGTLAKGLFGMCSKQSQPKTFILCQFGLSPVSLSMARWSHQGAHWGSDWTNTGSKRRHLARTREINELAIGRHPLLQNDLDFIHSLAIKVKYIYSIVIHLNWLTGQLLSSLSCWLLRVSIINFKKNVDFLPSYTNFWTPCWKKCDVGFSESSNERING